ncbi:MAG: GAF domain-containing protein [Ardenticatenia bacterium]|nr:GAF domain-containing protein [Ardenticatenia bacterium]
MVTIVPLLVVSTISFVLSRHTFRLADGQGTRLFSLLMVQIGWWTGFYALELISSSLEAKIVWAKVQYLAIASVPVTWFFFALTYTDWWPRLRTPRAVAPFVGVTLLILGAVWTNEYHRLFWATLRAEMGVIPSPLVATYGPLFYLFVGYANVLLAAGTSLLFKNLWRPFMLYRRQTVAVALGVFIPWGANLLYLLGVRLPGNMNPTPFAFAATGLMLLWGLNRFRLLDLVPLARDHLIEYMDEGVLVLDARGRIVDVNRQAAMMLQTHADALVGHPLEHLCPTLVNHLQALLTRAQEHVEVRIGQTTLQATLTSLSGRGWGQEHTHVGHLIVLRDVTSRKRVERMLEGHTQILSRLVTGAPLTSILDHIVLIIEELIPGAIGSILVVDDERGRLYHVAAPSLPERYVQAMDGIPIGPNAGSCGAAVYYRKPIVVTDIARDPMWRDWRDVALSYGLRSCWTVPIFTQDEEVMGTLTIYHTRRYTPTSTELDIVARAGHLVTLAVEREQSRTAMQRRETVLKAVAFAAETLLRAGNWELYIRHTLAYLASALGADRAFLFSVSAGPRGATLGRRQHLWPATADEEGHVWSDFTFEEHDLERWVRLLQRGMPVYGVADAMLPPERRFLARQRSRAVALLPIFAGNTWWGFVGFDRCAHSYMWSNAELDALKSVAALFGAAVQRWQLDQVRQRQMEEMQFLGQITGICLRADRLDEMLQTVAAHVAEFFKAHTCTVALWDERRHTFVPAATSGQTIIPPATLFPESVRVLIETALRTGRSQTMNRVPRLPHSSAAPYAQEQRLLAVPMARGQHWLGAILVEFRQPDQHISHHIDVAERVAAQVALAVARLHAVETAHRRAEEAETLRQAGTIVASTLDLDEAIDRILAQLADVIPHDSASVQLLHEEAETGLFLEIVGGWGWADMSQVRGLRFPVPGGNPNTTVVLERRPVVLGDAPAVYPSFRHPPHHHIRSWMGVPLMVRNKVIGMLAVDSKAPHHFTAHHVRLVTAFADQVAIAIENARLHQAVERKAQENARLYEAERHARRVAETLRLVNIAISQELAPEAVLETLLKHAQRLIPCDTANVLLCEGGGHVRLHTLRGYERWTETDKLKGRVIQLDKHPHLQEILTHERSMIIADTAQYPGWNPDEPPGTAFVRSWLGVPLIAMHEVVGVLSLDKAEANFFTEEHRQIAEALATQAAVAIQNARLFARVQRHAGQLRALYRATQTLLSTLDLDVLLQRVLGSGC